MKLINSSQIVVLFGQISRSFYSIIFCWWICWLRNVQYLWQVVQYVGLFFFNTHFIIISEWSFATLDFYVISHPHISVKMYCAQILLPHILPLTSLPPHAGILSFSCITSPLCLTASSGPTPACPSSLLSSSPFLITSFRPTHPYSESFHTDCICTLSQSPGVIYLL